MFISVFSGIRAMTSLPVQSMTTGGALWFTDLTVADPYFILPAICAVSIWAVTKVSLHLRDNKKEKPTGEVYMQKTQS